MSSHDLPGGSQTLATHLVDEASRFPIADVVKDSHSPFDSQRISPVAFTGVKEGPLASPSERAQGSQVTPGTRIIHNPAITQKGACAIASHTLHRGDRVLLA